MFHIVKKEMFRLTESLTSIDPKQLMKESLGQIKISITSNVNIRNLLNRIPQS